MTEPTADPHAPPPGLTWSTTHHYLSTACCHNRCGECRRTCKFCPSRCTHSCHTTTTTTPNRQVSDA